MVYLPIYILIICRFSVLPGSTNLSAHFHPLAQQRFWSATRHNKHTWTSLKQSATDRSERRLLGG